MAPKRKIKQRQQKSRHHKVRLHVEKPISKEEILAKMLEKGIVPKDKNIIKTLEKSKEKKDQ